MKNIIIILIILLALSCSKEKELNSDFFYNTQIFNDGGLCGPVKKSGAGTFSYKLDSLRVIYSCSKDYETKFTVTNDGLNEIYTELNFPEAKFNPWIVTYDNKQIIAIKTTPFDEDNMEIVSIDLNTRVMSTLCVLPYNVTYSFSEHPLSENGILIFNSLRNNVMMYNLSSKELNKNMFSSYSDPVISKDGRSVLYVFDQKVYLYVFETKKKELIYSSKDDKGYNAFNAFFGKEGEVIIKGIKTPGYKPLEKAEYLIVKNKKVIDRGQIDINKYYRYY
ncbi:hypothetical protein ABS768_13605 [Flavobacterium sp. ST-75]|uniref:WD40 repeat protein n=1 Tax=Flavobacterium rhizophilum TaxID=3163296 RepID=A0ABW8YE78_9FLAO